MISEYDMYTLRQAGIASIDALASAAAAFLREHSIAGAEPMLNALSEQEEDFLRQGGAAGVDVYDPSITARNVTVIAAEYAQMVAAAYTQKEAAECLGVGASRIRQRIDAGTLYAIDGPGGRVCPRWQFSAGGTLPGLERVLEAIGKEAHPLAVQRFFLAASPDLESKLQGQALSPRDWLLTGHSPEPVALLAREL
jgi:hypothetical protein